MPHSLRYLVTTTTAFLLVGLAALIAIVIMTLWLGERSQSYFQEAAAARDTRIAAVELRNAVQTAEASQRGFLLTGNEIYLAPYHSAKIRAQRHLSSLGSLLASVPDSDVRLSRLTEIVTAKFEDLDRTIALKRDQRGEEALTIFNTNDGKALTDEANVFFAGIIGESDSRSTSGLAEQRANARWLRLVSVIGAGVIIAVIGGAAYGMTQYTIELRASGDETGALNAVLEQRVSARTADLALARERAEILLSEVNHRVANSLALVSSMMTLQSRALSDQSAKDALAETQARVFAISLVHKRLYGSSDVRSVALDEYLSGLLDHLRTSLRSQSHGIGLSFSIEPIELDTDASISLGIIITELVTNAFKYAYPDGVGEIRIELKKRNDEQIELVVEDRGIGRAVGEPAKGTGVGTRIINAMCGSLGGTIEYRSLQPGTAAHLVIQVGQSLGGAERAQA